MTLFSKILIVAALCAIPLQASASNAELHAVGVYEGKTHTDGQRHGPEVHVHVARPGKDVTLVLLDYGPVRWFVTVSEETQIDQIILGGYDPSRSEVYLDGALFRDVRKSDTLQYVRQAGGKSFRQLVETAPQFGAFDRLDSFSGSYKAPETAFVVDTVDDDPNLAPDPLARVLADPETMPAKLRALVDHGKDRERMTQFTYDGMKLLRDTGEWQAFPATLDVPDISWPVASAFVPSENAIYGVSLGGDGYLYKVDVETGKWSVVRDMDGFDAQDLIYDEARHQFIMPGGVFAPNSILVYGLDGMQHSVSLKVSDLPGFTDLYDPGNGAAPTLKVLGVSDQVLLLLTDGKRVSRPGAPAPTRTWTFDLLTQKVQLVQYTDIPPLPE